MKITKNTNTVLEIKENSLLALIIMIIIFIGNNIKVINNIIDKGWSFKAVAVFIAMNLLCSIILVFCYENFVFKIDKVNKKCSFKRKTIKGLQENIHIDITDITDIYIDEKQELNETPSGRIIFRDKNKAIFKLPDSYIDLREIKEIYTELNKAIKNEQ